ncbi:hypothetical protein [Luteolibacter sp. Populi]|uniref:hypothetical protein n=1 Tax=Luteolibacter sp. Populi TaxID=3230487 RepID=UPI00346555E7
MKTAVLFHGLVQRSLRHVIGSIRECLLDPLAARGELRVFHHTWRLPYLDNPRAGESGPAMDVGEINRWLPESEGEADDEEEFVRTIDWSDAFADNPMRHHGVTGAGADASLRNLVLAVHSAERVFDRFAMSGYEADVVVLSRADLQFTRGVVVPDPTPEWTVFVPSFHGWGGLNDRFAFGSPLAMEIYARRSAFVEGWLLSPGRRNPEWVLKRWLKWRRMEVRMIEFPFRRVRADGSVFPLDQQLG